MKPRLNDWGWTVNGQDWIELKNFFPKQLDNFFIFGRLYIGNYENEGEDIFELRICSPRWFSENEFDKKGTNVLMGRHYLFMKEYNFQILNDFINKYLEEKCEGKDWKEVASKIGRLADWEFEDVDIEDILPSDGKGNA